VLSEESMLYLGVVSLALSRLGDDPQNRLGVCLVC
jgi:hypothetical protein